MFWTSTVNVLYFLTLLQFLRMMPPFSLVYISYSVTPFLLFWVQLKWFVLCTFLHFHIFIFSRTTPTFCSLKFLFFLYIIIQSLYFLLPLELIYFIHCLLHSSLPGIPFFLLFSPQSCVRCFLDLMYPFLFYFFILMVHTFRYSWEKFWGDQLF